MGLNGRITKVDVIKPSGFSREHKLMDRTLVDKLLSDCTGTPGTIDGKPQVLTDRVIYVWRLE